MLKRGPWLWLLADLTAVLIVILLPVSQLLRTNPYFKFRYGFDETLLALILLVFAVVPWILFGGVSVLAARRDRPEWRRVTLLIIVLLYVAQLYSTSLHEAGPLLRFLVPAGLLAAGSWLAWSRTRDFTILLAIGILLAGPYLAFQMGRHWWYIPKPPTVPSVAVASTVPGDLFFILLDGSSVTTDHLDENSLPTAELLHNFHRFVREDAHWFPNAVSNGPVTVVSLPSMLTGKLHATRNNNYLANEENLFTILDSRYETRVYLFTRSCFCQKESFTRCFPFTRQNYRGSMRMLVESFAFISSFRLSPLSFEIGKLNEAAYDRDAYVQDFLARLRKPATRPRLFAIQLFDRTEEDLREFDEFFGELCEILEASGRYEAATIAVVSDHGFNIVGDEFEYGFDAEQTRRLYRVPFAMKPPRRGAGAIYDYVAQGIDILPTLLAQVGAEEEVSGRSFDGVDLLSERPERVHYFSLKDREHLYRFEDEDGDGSRIVAVPVGEVLKGVQ